MLKIAYLALYPIHTAPSQRFRVEQFIPYWKKKNIHVDIFPFYSMRTYENIYQAGKFIPKTINVLYDFLRRIMLLFKLQSYPIIFVQRGVTPIGPPIFEWILKKYLKKKLIYDFDDAIWIPEPNSQYIVRKIKSYSKVQKICSLADQVIVGNSYLENYAKQFSKNIMIIPTVVDTEKKYLPYNRENNIIPVIGWTGSHSTMKYLELVFPTLVKLRDEINFVFKVISNKRPSLSFANLEFVKWSRDNEIEELNSFDIGIMPLTADLWSKGKCGFKAIQYMSLGIPSVVSPVGVNTKIIDHEKNGFHARYDDEWEKYIKKLLIDLPLRSKMGHNARKKIAKEYSIQFALPKWIQVFKKIAS